MSLSNQEQTRLHAKLRKFSQEFGVPIVMDKRGPSSYDKDAVDVYCEKYSYTRDTILRYLRLPFAKEPETPGKPKILIWDIESTSLNAAFGTILCIGWKWLHDPDDAVKVPTLFEHNEGGVLDDKGLVRHFAEIYNVCDYSVAHYGRRFDLPMVNTKLMKHGLPPLAPKFMLDTWLVARREMRMHSNRLAALAQYLDAAHSKTPLDFDHWLRAATGDRAALDYIVEHCRLDVLTLQDVFVKIRPWAREEPARHLFVDCDSAACVSCGSHALVRKGYHHSRTLIYPRWQCADCGKWQRSRKCERRDQLDKIGGW